MSYYNTAEICTNGHIISANSKSSNHEEFCSKCGSKTIQECPHCNAKLRGWEQSEGMVTIRSAKAVLPLPAYCYTCGKPYPWTESAIESATLLIKEEEDFSEEQKSKLIESIPDIVSETPRTNVATIRFKKALLSAGKFTADGIRQFCLDFACEVVKNSMGL